MNWLLVTFSILPAVGGLVANSNWGVCACIVPLGTIVVSAVSVHVTTFALEDLHAEARKVLRVHRELTRGEGSNAAAKTKTTSCAKAGITAV